jgi:hypothetical protein
MKRDLLSRFMSRVEKIPFVECWLWVGATASKGYGSFWVGNRTVQAHRWLWELERGAIPSGLQLDHLCRVRNCVRPSHLEPVTGRENFMRGFAPSAQSLRRRIQAQGCSAGHPLSRWDERRHRCRDCHADGEAARYETARGGRQKPRLRRSIAALTRVAHVDGAVDAPRFLAIAVKIRPPRVAHLPREFSAEDSRAVRVVRAWCGLYRAMIVRDAREWPAVDRCSACVLRRSRATERVLLSDYPEIAKEMGIAASTTT